MLIACLRAAFKGKYSESRAPGARSAAISRYLGASVLFLGDLRRHFDHINGAGP